MKTSRKAFRALPLGLGLVLFFVGAAAAFISGVDMTLIPPAPNLSLLLEIPPGTVGGNADGGGEISAVVFPYNGGSPAAANDHAGGNQDGGLANGIDDCAGAKLGVRWDPAGGDAANALRGYGSSTCNIAGANQTGVTGNFSNVSQVTTVNAATPSGLREAVIVTTINTPAAETRPMQIVQKTIIRGNNQWFATIHYVTNTSAVSYNESGGVRFFEGMDWNFDGSIFNDNSAYNSGAGFGADTVYGVKPGAPPGSIAYGGYTGCTGAIGGRASDAHDVLVYNTMWTEIRDNTLAGANAFAGDASSALRWNLGAIAAGATAVAPVIWGLGTTQAQMNANITAGCGLLTDVGISSVDSPITGSNALLGSTIPIGSTAALYGLVDQSNVNVQVNITGPACNSSTSAGTVNLSIPNNETVAAPVFNWNTAACVAGAYNVQVCTTLADQTAANDCQSITVNLRAVTLDPDQTQTVAPGTNVDYPLTLRNTGAADCVDFAVSASSMGWPSYLLDAAGAFLIASDTNGDGTWDFVAPGYDVGCPAANGLPDVNIGAGTPAVPTTINYTFRKAVPLTAPLGFTDTTLITANPQGGGTDTATLTTRTNNPPTQTKTLHLHPGLGMNTFRDVSADNTSTNIPAFSSAYFQQTAAMQTAFAILSPVQARLFIGTNNVARSIGVSLFATNGVSTIPIGPVVTQNVNTANNPGAATTFTINLAAPVTVPAGYRVTLQIQNNSASNNVGVWHDVVPTPSSRIDFSTTTYIQVTTAAAYNAAYPAGAAPASFAPTGVAAGAYLWAYIQDPFGDGDIGCAAGNCSYAGQPVRLPAVLTVRDPSNAIISYYSPVNCGNPGLPACSALQDVAMTDVSALGPADPSGNTYEYNLPLQSRNQGTYTATVSTYESNDVFVTRDFQFIISGTNAVQLTSFTATGYGNSVHLAWTTAQEINTLGYNIYRSTLPDRGWVQINWDVIRGLGYSDLGGSYLFADDTVEPGKTYFYLLEEVEFDGDTAVYGPEAAYTTPGTAAPAVSSTYLTSAVFLDQLPPSWYEAGTGAQSGQGGGEPPPAAGLTVTRSQEGEMLRLSLSIDVPPAQWSQVDVGGTLYDRVVVDGYGVLGVPGAPAVPARTFLVDVPPAMDFSWTLSKIEKIKISGVLVEPAAAPALPDGALNQAQDLATGPAPAAADPAVYGSNDPFPGAWVSVERGPAVKGGQTLLLAVYPVQAESASQTAEAASRIEMEITLTSQAELVAGTSAATRQWQIAAGAGLRVDVAAAGIQHLAGSALAAAGLDLSGPAANLQLFYHGQEIPLAVYDGGDGILDFGDFVEFYGETPSSEYAKTSAYWLLAGPGPGLRPTILDADPSGLSPLPAGTVHLTRAKTGSELFYFSTLNAPGENHWFHTAVSATAGKQASQSLTVAAPHLVTLPGDQAILGYEIRGQTTSSVVYPDHHIQIFLNGNPADEIRFDGQELVSRRVPVPIAWLVAGNNTVKFTAIADSGVTDASYIRYAELFYPRDFGAASDLVRFSPPVAGRYDLSGFSTCQVRLYDVADPMELGVLENASSSQAGTCTVSAGIPESLGPDNRAILAVTDSSVVHPAAAANAPSSLSDAANGADYLVITDGAFAGALSPLVSLRESQGLRVVVADVQDVYDEFSYGEQTPEAIRSLVERAREAWVPPAPRYLLLVGDSTYDAKDRWVVPFNTAPGQQRVPTLLYDNSYFRTASDNGLVLLDGELVPEIGVGRIPAQSVSQVQAVVAKILAYESTPMDEPFAQKVLLVSDNAVGTVKRDFDFVFPLFAGQTLKDIVTAAGFEPEVIVLPDAVGSTIPGGVAPVTAKIVQALTDGALLGVYAGHGAALAWADELIFRASNPLLAAGPSNPDNVAQIGNSSRLAVLAALDCLNAYFINPFAPSLGEVFLQDPDSGVVAFWGSAGLTPPNLQHSVAAALYAAMLSDGVVRLGDAARVAFSATASDPGLPDMVNTWILLGDPALRLRINHPPVAQVSVPDAATAGTAAEADGSASSDPNEDPIGYSWEISGSPEGSELLGATGTGAKIDFVPDVPGKYDVTLTVTDSFGASSTAGASFAVGKAAAPGGGPGAGPPAQGPAAGGCQMGGQSRPVATLLALAVAAGLLHARRKRRLGEKKGSL